MGCDFKKKNTKVKTTGIKLGGAFVVFLREIDNESPTHREFAPRGEEADKL